MWSVVIIALDVIIIYALTARWAEARAGAARSAVAERVAQVALLLGRELGAEQFDAGPCELGGDRVAERAC